MREIANIFWCMQRRRKINEEIQYPAVKSNGLCRVDFFPKGTFRSFLNCAKTFGTGWFSRRFVGKNLINRIVRLKLLWLRRGFESNVLSYFSRSLEKINGRNLKNHTSKRKTNNNDATKTSEYQQKNINNTTSTTILHNHTNKSS